MYGIICNDFYLLNIKILIFNAEGKIVPQDSCSVSGVRHIHIA